MRNNYLFNSYLINGSRILKFFLLMILISFPLIASDCQKALTNEQTIPDKFLGNWRLVQQTGALQDICPQEYVNFRSDGVAELTCPDSQTILRAYSLTNTELKYDQTSLHYEYEFTDSDQKLNLYGVNVSRNLFYEKVTADNTGAVKGSGNDQNNSSEAVK